MLVESLLYAFNLQLQQETSMPFLSIFLFASHKPHRESSSFRVVECVINSLRAGSSGSINKEVQRVLITFPGIAFVVQISAGEVQQMWEISMNQRCFMLLTNQKCAVIIVRYVLGVFLTHCL